MNRPPIQDLIENQLSRLPKVNQDLLSDSTVDDLVTKIQEEFSLAEFETDDIAIEIAYILFNISPLNEFKSRVEDSVGKGGTTAQSIVDICNKEIFSKLTPAQEKTAKPVINDSASLNHVDILNEIENPTPSIVSKEAIPQVAEENKAEEVKKPTLEEALSGVLPTEGGFSFNEASHPAEPMAQKLDQKLSNATVTAPKEIYVVKKPDPYHEPIE
jgi:hypothetical protein